MNSYKKLLGALHQKDWTAATEQFRDIMEQKVAIRLAEEKQQVAHKVLTEGASKFTAKGVTGHGGWVTYPPGTKLPGVLDYERVEKVVKELKRLGWKADIDDGMGGTFIWIQLKRGLIANFGTLDSDKWVGGITVEDTGDYLGHITTGVDEFETDATKIAIAINQALQRKLNSLPKMYREERVPLTTYFTGNDKDGWVLIHQGQPMNANPQGGIPVSRERVQRVAKQFGFKDVMVWNGKNYTYSFGESWGDGGTVRKHTCRKCHNYWMGPSDDNECPKCGASEFSESEFSGVFSSENCKSLKEAEAENCERCGKWSGQSTLCADCKGARKAEWDKADTSKVEKSLKKHGLR